MYIYIYTGCIVGHEGFVQTVSGHSSDQGTTLRNLEERVDVVSAVLAGLAGEAFSGRGPLIGGSGLPVNNGLDSF